MFIETLDSYPDELKADFVPTEMDGKKGFMHKTDTALVNSLKNAKTEREAFKLQLDEVSTKLNGFEESKKSEIEAARNEAMENARSKGDVKAIEERYQQQMADAEKRASETNQQYQERIDKLTGNLKSKTKTAVISDIAKELSTDVGYNLFKKVLADRIDVDVETGKEIYLNEDGSASSLDKKGFMDELLKDDSFKPLLKSGVVTQGGGNVSGSGEGSASTAKQVTRAEFDSWSDKKRSDFSKAGGSAIN